MIDLQGFDREAAKLFEHVMIHLDVAYLEWRETRAEAQRKIQQSAAAAERRAQQK